jgi:hypothetical protein
VEFLAEVHSSPSDDYVMYEAYRFRNLEIHKVSLQHPPVRTHLDPVDLLHCRVCARLP